MARPIVPFALSEEQLELFRWRAERGGRRQREKAETALALHFNSVHVAGAAEAATTETLRFDSEQAVELIKEFLLGAKSAAEVQHLANLAYNDQRKILGKPSVANGRDIKDAASVTLKSLGSLGNCGRRPQHCNTELLNFLGPTKLPRPLEIDVRLKIPKPKARRGFASFVNVSYPMILPHIMFAFLFVHNRASFDSLILGATAAHPNPQLDSFWETILTTGDPRIQGHPMRSRPNWMQKMIPLALHGDAVPVTRVGKKGSQSYDAYSWQSVLARGTTLQIKHLIFGIFENNKTRAAMDGLWDVLVWSFYFLYLGIWPTVDWKGVAYAVGSPEALLAGTLLAGGYAGVIWLIKGDFDHFAKNIYCRSYRHNLLCEWCPADQGKHNVNYRTWPNYFEPDAEWIRDLYDIGTWETLHVLHKLFALGFLSHHNIEPDELHIIYLGIAQYFLGSILALLCYHILPQSPANNMGVVWECILRHYSFQQVSSQFGSLTLASIFGQHESWGDTYPNLKGGKGAELKWLLVTMVAVWRELVGADPSDPPSLNGRCERALASMATIIEIIDDETENNFLRPESSLEIIRLTDLFLHDYSRLSKASDDNDLMVFTNFPKLHYLWHWARRCRFLHPRRGCCFGDEEFVGIIKKIAHSCCKGNPLNRAGTATVFKYNRWRDFDLRYSS